MAGETIERAAIRVVTVPKMLEFIDGECVTPMPGDDLSYHLGDDARCATQEQCDELEAIVAEVRRSIEG